MPGTWGSLAALPCAWAIRGLWGTLGLAVAIALVLAIGWWAAGTVARASAAADPAEIVIDEVAGQWLALLATPLAPLPYAAGLVIFRIFDIWKPWPVSWADRNVKGGLGIMLDDLLAAVYAFFVLAVISGVFGVWG